MFIYCCNMKKCKRSTSRCCSASLSGIKSFCSYIGRVLCNLLRSFSMLCSCGYVENFSWRILLLLTWIFFILIAIFNFSLKENKKYHNTIIIIIWAYLAIILLWMICSCFFKTDKMAEDIKKGCTCIRENFCLKG